MTSSWRHSGQQREIDIPLRIHFMGVWDTVGALGIPRIFDKDWIPRFSSKYQFHDTALCEGIRNAFHAVAIDEQRLPYKATLWTEKQVLNEQVEQRWFPEPTPMSAADTRTICFLPAFEMAGGSSRRVRTSIRQ
jgi:uncharacterized protein (DUF2235 family)